MKTLLLLLPVGLLVSACAPGPGGPGYGGPGYYGGGGAVVVEGRDRGYRDGGFYGNNSYSRNVTDVNVNRTNINDETVNRTNVNESNLSRTNVQKTDSRHQTATAHAKGRETTQGSNHDDNSKKHDEAQGNGQ